MSSLKKLRSEYQGAIDRKANNQFWGGVINQAVGGSVDAISGEIKTRRQADANETALQTLNPNLAGKGLGDALARNPSLSDSLLGPYIQGQNQQARDDRIAARQTELERFSSENQLSREKANDERDFANTQTLDAERAKRSIAAEGFADEGERAKYLQGSREREALRDEAERKKIEADTLFTSEQRKRQYDDDTARADKIKADEARRNEPLPSGFTSDRVPPRYMARIKTWGELEDEEARLGKLHEGESKLDVNEARIKDYESRDLSRRERSDMADRVFASKEFAESNKGSRDAQEESRLSDQNFIRAYQDDPEMRNDPMMTRTYKDAMKRQGQRGAGSGTSAPTAVEPESAAEDPDSTYQAFSEKAPSLKSKGNSAAYKKNLGELQKVGSALKKARERGLKTENLEAKYAELSELLNQLAEQDEIEG